MSAAAVGLQEDWIPLTAAQQGLWFAHELDPTNPCHTTAEVVEFPERVDASRLAAAVAAAHREFEQTRTRFTTTPQGPRQQVLAEGRPLEVIEVSSRAEAEQFWTQCLARPMDLTDGDVTRSVLLRLQADVKGETRDWWFHAAHHVVSDGYGAHQFLSRVADLYSDRMESVRDAVVSLTDLVAADTADAEGEAAWEEVVAGIKGTASLTGRAHGPAARAVRASTTLDVESQREVKEAARRFGVSWPDLLVAVVATYVGRMTGIDDVRVGLPLMNRTRPGVGTAPSARTVCTAMNVLPARVRTDGDLGTALASVVAEQQWLRRHPTVRQEVLSRQLSQRDPGAQLFGTQVNVIPFGVALNFDAPTGGAVGSVRNLTAGPVEDLTVCFRGMPGRGGAFHLEVDANPLLHPADELSHHLSRLVSWLKTVCRAAPTSALRDLDLLTPHERHWVLETVNDTDKKVDAATLGERFRRQAASTPCAVALVCEGRTRTYAQVLERAERVAAGLAGEGVRPGDVVGVALERGLDLLEVVHGVMLAGAAYLPLDLDLPPARRSSMVEDAEAVRVIAADDIPDAPPIEHLPLADLDDPAYVLFTSGSTGRPKGVVVAHRAIDNRLAWQQHHLGLQVGERVLHKTPISFDVSVWELFWPLQVGATLVIAPPGVHRDPVALGHLMAQEDVDVVHFVPSMLRAFLGHRGARDLARATGLRHVVTSGEALTPDLVDECVTWFGVAPTNLYGPTEAAIDVTVWDCVAGQGTVPIGRPVWNTRCYVLDAQLQPVPLGVTGELWLAGVQLAEGYVGRDDLTAERFLPDPFVTDEALDPGASTVAPRMYRTGDLAAWRADGALRLLGRTDDQVKIRGQRIELGEIEAAVAGVVGARSLAAGTVADANGTRLVLWFAVDEAAEPDEVEAALRQAARVRLPESWLPQHWLHVDDIPVGTSGKTDRRRLAEEHPPGRAQAESRSAPLDLDEQRWCELLETVLDRDDVQREDDFFALGGDSLAVLRLIAAARDALEVEVMLSEVFAHPTPAGLAALASGAARGDTTAGTGELLTLRRGDPGAAGVETPPLFLLPPAGGLGWCYTSLLSSLDPSIPVHAIQASGIERGTPAPVGDLAGLAERQLGVIRSVVGRGPFHVAGWSLGGMAAHALARQARLEGQEVGSVVLLDAYPSDQWSHLPHPTESEALAGVLRLGGIDPPVDELDLDRVVNSLREGGSALGHLPRETLAGCVRSVVQSAALVRGSVHDLLPGDLTVVVAGAPRAETWLDPGGWAPYVGGLVHVVEVDATHGDLVRRPAVDRVGALLTELLA